MDAPESPVAQAETNLIELKAFVDANYRTKQPAAAEVPID